MPSLSTLVPTIVPTTHGRPYSRETIAQWLSTPPVSATTAETVENSGVQGGIVISHTSTSPGSILLASVRLRTTFTRAFTVPRDAGMPAITSVSRLGSGGTPNIFMSANANGSIGASGGGGAPMTGTGMIWEKC